MGIKLLIEFFQNNSSVSRNDAKPVRSRTEVDLGKIQKSNIKPAQEEPAIKVDVRRLNDGQKMARDVLEQNQKLNHPPVSMAAAEEVKVPVSLWERLGKKRTDLERAIENAVESPELISEAHDIDRSRVEDLLLK